MSAAAFVLAINLFIAAIFATAFGVVAAYNRSAVGARWLALAYGLGIVNPLLEFILPGQADPRPVQVAIFAVFLFAFSLSVIGLSRPRNNRTFAGLALDAELEKRGAEARCGLIVVDLRSGDTVHWLRLEGVVEELYDVVALPGVRRPMALGLKTDEIRRTLSIGPAESL